ncbi:MAG: prepilin peptidase [bacterium]|nr:prepilin peptidase [bacterium]
MISFFVFLAGLVIGSFLNAAIYRLEQGESVLKGRSYCPHCRHTLAWYDLVPLLSFVFLQGRCRHCAKKISLQYPLVELASGILFVAAFFTLSGGEALAGFSGAAQVAYLWTVFSLLLFVFVYDLKHFIIPDVAVYPAAALALLWQATLGGSLLPVLLSALGAAMFFYAIHAFSKGAWMGLGDAKLALFMGLFLGFPGILTALFLAFLAGAAVGVTLIMLKKKGMRSEVPFGPFLVLGTLAALFWGNELVDFYLSFFWV